MNVHDKWTSRIALIVVLLLLTAGPMQAQGSGWSTPQMISTNTLSSWWPDVAVDHWGQPHVVWNSGQGTDGPQMDLLMYSTLIDQAWLEPCDIAVTAYGGYTVRPTIAADRTGLLHTAFRGRTVIYYSHAPIEAGGNAAAWSPRQRISGPGNDTAYYSDIAVDESGRIHIVWNEGVAASTGEKWLWLGTPNGLVVQQGDVWQSPELPESNSPYAIHAIIEDRNGVQWFATSEGVLSFDGGTWQRLAVQDSLLAQQVNAIAEDVNGNLWFATDQGASAYYVGENDVEWTAYTVRSGLPDNAVYAIAAERLGGVWLGTANGLAHFDGIHWTRYPPQEGLIGPSVSAIALDRHDNLWAATDQGVSFFDGQQWVNYTVDDGLPSNVVQALAVDAQGAVWAGTDNGLCRFDGARWTSIAAQDGLAEGAVSALMVDQAGTVWAATEGGLGRYDEHGWQAVELPAAVAGQEITAIGQDRQVNAVCVSCADIFYRHSDNGGATWSSPVNLSNSLAGSVKPQLRLGNDGNLYVAWEEGEDWYLHEGYPVSSMVIHSTNNGETWAAPVTLSPAQGVSQQIILGVTGNDSLVAVWRLPETDTVYYYQTSVDQGSTWSNPQPIPGVIAKDWGPYSLDGYDAATDAAGNVHMLILGRLSPFQEELGLVHLIWNGSNWSTPVTIYASSDPPEWPRLDVGAGNQVYATWFTRDQRHLNDSERGRYRIWVSSFQADAPAITPLPFPEHPTLPATPTTPAPPPATATCTPFTMPQSSQPPQGMTSESDEIGWLLVALSPVVLLLLTIVLIRLVRYRLMS